LIYRRLSCAEFDDEFGEFVLSNLKTASEAVECDVKSPFGATRMNKDEKVRSGGDWGCIVLGTQDAKMEIPVITESAGGMGDI